jgi:hypothetical protein
VERYVFIMGRYSPFNGLPLTIQLKEFADKHKTQSAGQPTPASAAAAAIVNASKVCATSPLFFGSS